MKKGEGWSVSDSSAFDDEGEVRKDNSQIWTVVWDDQSDHEERENVEDDDTPENLLGSFWDFFSWVTCLGSG